MTQGKRRSRQAEPEQEIDIEVCCEALHESIEEGGVKVVEAGPGVYCEAIAAADGASGMIVNYCPFCGSARAGVVEAESDEEGVP